MRKYAILKEPVDEIKKVMVYACSEGVYLFLYNLIDDVPAFADYFYSSLEDAEEDCLKDYLIKKSDWFSIDDPLNHCQHDIIAPVRVKGRELGKPQWGQYEILENGKWVEYKFLTR